AQPRRLVLDVPARVDLIDVLPARPAAAAPELLDVLRVDLDLDVLHLRQHRDGRRRRVNPTLRLGLRHALHAVPPALVLTVPISARALDVDDDLLEPAPLGRR